MDATSARLRKTGSTHWPMVVVLDTITGDCAEDCRSSHHQIGSKSPVSRLLKRLTRPGSMSLKEKWYNFALPSPDCFKRNRMEPIMENNWSDLNDSLRDIFDTTPGETSESPGEARHSDQCEPAINHQLCSQAVGPAEEDEESDASNATIRAANRFSMPVARQVLPSQETVDEDEDIWQRRPEMQLLDDSDEDMFLEIHRLPVNDASTPITRNVRRNETPGSVHLPSGDGSPTASRALIIPNMMLRSPSVFARLSTDLQAPRLNLNRRKSVKTLFSVKRLRDDDMEDAGPSSDPVPGKSTDDDEDNFIGFRRSSKVRRITDTQSDAIKLHDSGAEDRTATPARLKKIAREFIHAEAEASDGEMETEEEASTEGDDSFIVPDSQVEQGTPVSSERAMYLQSVRDVPRAGAFCFPNRRQPPVAVSPMSADTTYSQQDTYDQSFLDEDARADSHLSVLEQLEAKLETRNRSDSNNSQ